MLGIMVGFGNKIIGKNRHGPCSNKEKSINQIMALVEVQLWTENSGLKEIECVRNDPDVDLWLGSG